MDLGMCFALVPHWQPQIRQEDAPSNPSLFFYSRFQYNKISDSII
jgi:hypothetical protein